MFNDESGERIQALESLLLKSVYLYFLVYYLDTADNLEKKQSG